MLRNSNHLANINQKMWNFRTGIRMASKVVSQGRGWTTFRQRERLGIWVPTPQAHVLCLTVEVRKAQACRISKYKLAHKVQNERQCKQDAKAHHTRAQKTTKRSATTNVPAPQRHQSSSWATSGWTRRRPGLCNPNPTAEVVTKLDFVPLQQELLEQNIMVATAKQSVITWRVIIPSRSRDEMSIRLAWTMISK